MKVPDRFTLARSTSQLLFFCGVVLLVACEDKRVKAIDTGLTRDSAIAILTGGKKSSSPDTFPNVHRRSRYLIKGKELEVLFFAPNGEMPRKDTILPFHKLTPIVIYGDKVIGKGWSFWDSTSLANGIALTPKDS